MLDKKLPSSYSDFDKVRLLLSIAAVCLLVFYLAHYVEDLKNIYLLGLSEFGFLTFLIFLSFLANGFRLKITVGYAGINLKKKEWFGLSIVNSMWSQFLPKGGSANCLLYLKHKYREKASILLIGTVLGSSYLVTIFSTSILGLCALSLLYPFLPYYYVKLLLLLFLMALSILLFLFVLSKKKYKAQYKIVNLINKLFNLWNNIAKHNKLIVLCLVDTFIIAVHALRFYICFNAIDINIPYLFALLLSSITYLSLVINVTPSGIGIRELIVGLLAETYGIESHLGVLATLIDRFAAVIWILILGLYFQHVLIKKTEGIPQDA